MVNNNMGKNNLIAEGGEGRDQYTISQYEYKMGGKQLEALKCN